jgi:hypothetical protein
MNKSGRILQGRLRLERGCFTSDGDDDDDDDEERDNEEFMLFCNCGRPLYVTKSMSFSTCYRACNHFHHILYFKRSTVYFHGNVSFDYKLL